MNNSHLAKHIGRQLTWLETWRQPSGYGGPVVHYWKDSLCYTGPGLDWRYEGIIISFLRLYEKTAQAKFLNLAIQAGNHLVEGQLPAGQYLHSGFDGNPSGNGGSMPHDTAASIGLMRLALVLRQSNNPLWKLYYATAKKNLNFHMNYLYDPRIKLFLQTFPSLDHRRHIVPNKHATLAELLILFYKMTKNQEYIRLAERCAKFVISQQDHNRFFGGIHQTDKNHSYISIYIARCVSGLLAVYDATHDSQYLQSALEAAAFLKTLEKPGGGFYFGWRDLGDGFYRYKYPQFVAGAGDILRAFLLLRPYKKYPISEHVEWINEHSNSHGGVWTSIGMNMKNIKYDKEVKKPFWRDVIPVAGWNDKTLRLRVELLKDGTSVPLYPFIPTKVECSNGVYEEDKDKLTLTILKNKQYIFHKQKILSHAQVYFSILFALNAQKYLPPSIWEKFRRFGQWKAAFHQPGN